MTDDIKKDLDDGVGDVIETADEFCASTGLIEGTTNIEMRDDNMYIVLTKEEVPADAGEGMGAVGVALLSSNGGDQYLAIIAAGMCELLRNDPDLLIHAGYEFMDRASGIAAGTETVQ